MQEIERSAPSVEEAVEAALAELGVSEQEAVVEVVRESRAGRFGIGAQPAVVRVRRRSPAAGAPGATEHPGEPEGEQAPGRGEAGAEAAAVDEQADIVADFLEELVEHLDLDADVEIVSLEEGTYVDIWGAEGAAEDLGLLIGRRGATLDALQELVRGVVLRQTGERCRVLVDVEDYRKRRRARVIGQARDAARRVRQSGRAEAMEPMNPYERKLVHDAVGEIGGVETISEGEEPNRRVVIRPRHP